MTVMISLVSELCPESFQSYCLCKVQDSTGAPFTTPRDRGGVYSDRDLAMSRRGVYMIPSRTSTGRASRSVYLMQMLCCRNLHDGKIAGTPEPFVQRRGKGSELKVEHWGKGLRISV